MRYAPAQELYAIVNLQNAVIWTAGGSSTKPHLMIYTSYDSAVKALRYAPREITCRVAKLAIVS